MYTFEKYNPGKHGGWSVRFPNGELVAVTMYRKGAIALCKLLNNYKKEIEK